jgi:type I restriction enzyme S subunit
MMRKRLPEVCDIQYGFPFDSAQFSDITGMPLIRIRDVVRGYSETYTTEKCNDEYIVQNGDMLIGMDGEFNIAKWNGGQAYLNQRVCRLVPKDEIDSGYLFYFMPKALKQIEEKTPFVTVKHLSAKQLNSIEISLPTMGEQKHVAVVLDKVSELIVLRKQHLAKLDELVKSRFIELFGDPVSNPKGWPMRELSEYIIFLTSGSRGWAQYFTDTGEYFITIKNVKNCRITLDNVQHITAPDNAEAKRTKVQEGDLLISITADLGRTGVVSKEVAAHGGYINQHLTCIRLNQDVVRPLYVAYYMESDAGKEQFQAKNQSAVKAGLNFNSINTLKLMVPPIALQDRFIAFVEQVDKSKYYSSLSYSSCQMATNTYRQEWMTCQTLIS